MSACSCNFCNNYSKQMQDHNKCNCQIEFACHDVCLLPCSQWDETMQLHSRGIFHLIRITTVFPDVTRPSKEHPQLPVFKALLIPSMTAERWNSFVINYPDKPMCCIEKKMDSDTWIVFELWFLFPLTLRMLYFHNFVHRGGRAERIFNFLTGHFNWFVGFVKDFTGNPFFWKFKGIGHLQYSMLNLLYLVQEQWIITSKKQDSKFLLT